MKFPGFTFQVLVFGLLGPALDSGASHGESEGYGGCRASGFKAPSRRAFELQPSSHPSQSLRTDPSSARTLCVFVLIPWVHKLRLLVFCVSLWWPQTLVGLSQVNQIGSVTEAGFG